uniref:Uncharacterized protein n=1 Tax=Rhizophora mucronata TaxID=61149 RepID=A0A2P2PBG0_RHIMU
MINREEVKYQLTHRKSLALRLIGLLAL